MKATTRQRPLLRLHLLLALYSCSGVLGKLAAGMPFLSLRFCACYGAMIALLGIYAVGWPSVVAYRAVPLSMGPILEATGYVYVTLFGVRVFHERMTRTKWVALALIIAGICVYTVGAAR